MHPILAQLGPFTVDDARRVHGAGADGRPGDLLPRAAPAGLARAGRSSGSRSRRSSAARIGARVITAWEHLEVYGAIADAAVQLRSSSTAARASSARSPAATSRSSLAKRAFGYTRSTGDALRPRDPGRDRHRADRLLPVRAAAGHADRPAVGRLGRARPPRRRSPGAPAATCRCTPRCSTRSRSTSSPSPSILRYRDRVVVPGDAAEALPARGRDLPVPRRVRPRQRAAGARA